MAEVAQGQCLVNPHAASCCAVLQVRRVRVGQRCVLGAQSLTGLDAETRCSAGAHLRRPSCSAAAPTG